MSIKKGQYHCAINGQGYLLAGTPERPARIMEETPKYGDTPSGIDLEYSDASQFFPWSQTDWSGGFQEEKWVDKATFKIGENIDVISTYGEISLQPTVVAVKTDFATGQTFGASIIANNYLVIGTKHATAAAQLWYLDSSDAKVQVTTGWTSIISVNDIDIYQDKILLALKRSTGTEYTLQSYDFTTMANLRDTSTEVRCVKVISDRIYEAELNSLVNGDRLIYSDDDGSTWDDIITKTGQNREIQKMADNYGILYFIIVDGFKVELWKVSDVYPEPIYTFNYLVNPDLKAYLGNVFISGQDENGNTIIYAWNGSSLSTSFSESVDGITVGPKKLCEFEGNLISQGLVFDNEFWSPHIKATEAGGATLIPFISFGSTTLGNLYFYASTTTSTSTTTTTTTTVT